MHKHSVHNAGPDTPERPTARETVDRGMVGLMLGKHRMGAYMTDNTHLITALEKQIAAWEALAREARTRADARRPGDLSPAYLYGVADQLERNADDLRKVIEGARRRGG